MSYSYFTIEATVATGFEIVLKEECLEKLNVEGRIEKGRVFFEIAPNLIPKVLSLRGADNIYVVIYKGENIDFPQTTDELKNFFEEFSPKIKWEEALEAWRNAAGFPISGHNMTIKYRTKTDAQEDTTNDKMVFNLPTFRVTCHRVGEKHNFSSQDAAARFGGAICDMFQWTPQMKSPNIHVYLDINENQVLVSLPLTLQSLHRRNLIDFGPTSLRSTIAHNMLRLCKIQPNDVICDPMCGGGSIPIEGAINWPNAYHICGDNHDKAFQRTDTNLVHNNQTRTQKNQLKLDIFRWDASKLPLKDHSVDVFVTDLPFGKRLGSKYNNITLYPAILAEMGRVCKPENGRAVLLTKDRYSMIAALSKCRSIWHCAKTFKINLGGLMPTIYMLQRTTVAKITENSIKKARRKGNNPIVGVRL